MLLGVWGIFVTSLLFCDVDKALDEYMHVNLFTKRLFLSSRFSVYLR